MLRYMIIFMIMVALASLTISYNLYSYDQVPLNEAVTYHINVTENNLSFKVITYLKLQLLYNGIVSIPLILVDQGRSDKDLILSSFNVDYLNINGTRVDPEIKMGIKDNYTVIYLVLSIHGKVYIDLCYNYITSPTYKYGDGFLREIIIIPSGLKEIEKAIPTSAVHYYLSMDLSLRDPLYTDFNLGNTLLLRTINRRFSLVTSINGLDKPMYLDIALTCSRVPYISENTTVSIYRNKIYIYLKGYLAYSSSVLLIEETRLDRQNRVFQVYFVGCQPPEYKYIVQVTASEKINNLYVLDVGELNYINIIEIYVNKELIYSSPISKIPNYMIPEYNTIIEVSVYEENALTAEAYVRVLSETVQENISSLLGSGEQAMTSAASTESPTSTEAYGESSSLFQAEESHTMEGATLYTDAVNLLIALAIAIGVGLVLHFILMRR